MTCLVWPCPLPANPVSSEWSFLGAVYQGGQVCKAPAFGWPESTHGKQGCFFGLRSPSSFCSHPLPCTPCPSFLYPSLPPSSWAGWVLAWVQAPLLLTLWDLANASNSLMGGCPGQWSWAFVSCVAAPCSGASAFIPLPGRTVWSWEDKAGSICPCKHPHFLPKVTIPPSVLQAHLPLVCGHL